MEKIAKKWQRGATVPMGIASYRNRHLLITDLI